MRDETKQKHTVTCMIWHARRELKKVHTLSIPGKLNCMLYSQPKILGCIP